MGIVLGVLLVLMQLVPFGRAHPNPPVESEPDWPSPEDRALVVRACFDCHSNETQWPWYSYVAPISWLVANDVEEGRYALNFSKWEQSKDMLGAIADVVDSGSMPPWYYELMHPAANLSESDRARLVNMFGRVHPAALDPSGE